MKTEIDISNWNRKEHFEFFSAFDEPFFGITTPIDCTIAMKKAKKIQIPFFVYYLHKTLAAINSYKQGQWSLFDKLKVSRIAFLNAFVNNDPKQSVNLHGWLRRVGNIQYGKLVCNNGKIITW